jgi:hypothetical protein
MDRSHLQSVDFHSFDQPDAVNRLLSAIYNHSSQQTASAAERFVGQFHYAGEVIPVQRVSLTRAAAHYDTCASSFHYEVDLLPQASAIDIPRLVEWGNNGRQHACQ